MATDAKNIFLTQSEIKAEDSGHRKKIQQHSRTYRKAHNEAIQQFQNIDWIRKKAKQIKWEAIENLDTYLLSFEEQCTKNGGEVIWADNAQSANESILSIFKKHNANKALKSKSNLCEEIDLKSNLASNGISVQETDLGDIIQQLDNESPYHMVTPAIHKSEKEIASLFHQHFHSDTQLTAAELAPIARKEIRKHLKETTISIHGGNFILADTGGIALTENEGNIRLLQSEMDTNIFVVGIDKIVPSINDLEYFWPLLSSYGTGQKTTSYNSVFNASEHKKTYVILVDNGRSELIAEEQIRESTYCIKCGACQTLCGVYNVIGGHTYNSKTKGAIGAVISPHKNGYEEYIHLSEAALTNGPYNASCPVHINIDYMLQFNRQEAIANDFVHKTEKTNWKDWKNAMLHKGLGNKNKKKKGAMECLFVPVYIAQRAKKEKTIAFNETYSKQN